MVFQAHTVHHLLKTHTWGNEEAGLSYEHYRLFPIHDVTDVEVKVSVPLKTVSITNNYKLWMTVQIKNLTAILQESGGGAAVTQNSGSSLL